MPAQEWSKLVSLELICSTRSGERVIALFMVEVISSYHIILSEPPCPPRPFAFLLPAGNVIVVCRQRHGGEHDVAIITAATVRSPFRD